MTSYGSSTPDPLPTSTMTDALNNSPLTATRLSRRGLLAAGAAALGVAGASRLGSGTVGAEASELNAPGQALAPAERVTTTTSTSTTTTTTTTIPSADVSKDVSPYVPPADGEIPFPIVVGPDDSCYVLKNFGACRGSGCSRSHEGVDIMADKGLAIRAVADGVLTKKYVDSGRCGGAGNGWTLTDEDNDIVYKFFHMNRHEAGLEQGDAVVAGQIIGYVGETGTSGVCSTTQNNYHLHFEYRPGNTARNSFSLLERAENVEFG